MSNNTSFNELDSNEKDESTEIEFSNTQSLFRLKILLPEYNPESNESAPDNGFEYFPAPIGQKAEDDSNIIDKPLLKENNCSCPQVVENKIELNHLSISGVSSSNIATTPMEDISNLTTTSLLSLTTPIGELSSSIFELLPQEDVQLIFHDEGSKLENGIEISKSNTNTPPPINVKHKFQNNSRKYKPDSIRKKIKSRTLKNIKNILNNKIKKAGGIMFFDYLPQEFVSNVRVGINKEILEYSFRKLLTKDFGGKAKDKEKLANNIRALAYLDNHPNIKSSVDYLLTCSFKSLCNLYFGSSDFKNEFIKLKSEGEDDEYIEKYKKLAFTLVSFYENNGKHLKL